MQKVGCLQKFFDNGPQRDIRVTQNLTLTMDDLAHQTN